jgi:hypothetical protein
MQHDHKRQTGRPALRRFLLCVIHLSASCLHEGCVASLQTMHSR